MSRPVAALMQTNPTHISEVRASHFGTPASSRPHDWTVPLRLALGTETIDGTSVRLDPATITGPTADDLDGIRPSETPEVA